MPLMDKKPSRRELSHDRILDTAARAIRRSGFAGTGVADIMKEAGLTHGGFYAHFASRNALLVEAMERAGRDSFALRTQVAEALRRNGASPFRALVESYLSESHRESLELGCPLAALGSEFARQSPEVQAVAAARLQGFIRVIEKTLPAAMADQAGVVAATLIGALQVARAMGDAEQGRAILRSTQTALLERYEPPTAE